jgi:biofilm PGA synthesis N-glycosyltransferase PgaC
MNFIPLTFYSFSFFVIIAYAIILVKAASGIKKVKTNITSNSTNVSVDVIIAYQNELSNLSHLIKSLQNQTYQNFRVIWVNDHSTDGGPEFIKRNWIKENAILTNNPQSGKKTAIEHGIGLSNAELIVFTDADCLHAPKWIEEYADIYNQKGSGVFFGPVVYETNSFKENIFNLEFLSIMGTGIGLAGNNKPVYMNGANYAISKNLLSEINNKAGNQYASGDDVFLLHHIKKVYGSSKINPIINERVLVKTQPPKTISQFFRQRIRWGGKTTGYRDSEHNISCRLNTHCQPPYKLASLVFGIPFRFGSLLIWPAKASCWIL